MVKNPFKIGKIVSGDPFCNRKKEIARLKSAFLEAQNIVLISPRRWGKSSLVNEALGQIRKNAVIVELDCFGITSEKQFLENYLKTMVKASQGQIGKSIDFLKKYLGSIVPHLRFSYGLNDDIKVNIDFKRSELDPKEILDLPAKIHKDKKVPVVICIDEFQKLAELPEGGALLETLRASWQKHTGIAYCLYGSKRHLMSEIFNESSKPFYRFGETIFLEKIGATDWIAFLQAQFKKTKKEITAEQAGRIAELAEYHSYYVQYLARVVWSDTTTKVSDKIINESYQTYLTDHTALFRSKTENLTKYQINFLRALLSGEKQFSSRAVLKEYDLGSQGNIKRILASLEASEIIDTFTGGPVLLEPYFAPLFRKYFMQD